VLDASYADPVGAILYGVSNRALGHGTLRTSLLPFYERVVLPLSKAATPVTRGIGGKNIILIARRRTDDD
jgi:hypothetical protein